MHRSLSRCFGASAVLAFTLTACGGGVRSTLDASLPAKNQNAALVLKPPPGKNVGIIAPRNGILPSLLVGRLQAELTGERNRRAGILRLLPFLGGTGIGIPNVVVPIGLSGLDLTLAAAAAPAKSTALVLYDTAGQWGYLGELYAMAVANLAGHFGKVSTEPISAYASGQVNQYTATIYIGSTYYNQTNDGIPPQFYTDVAASARPVIWIGDNIWNFADRIGVTAFDTKYGWDPTNSYFTNSSGGVGTVTQVAYKNEPLPRTIPAGDDGGVLRPDVLGGSFPAVTTVAQASDTSTSPATNFPWALRSGNLTYIGEIPFDYVSQSDRIIAFEDMLFDALAPSTATRHRAMMRLEDLNATDDQTQLMAVAQYLNANHIPYGFNVIPQYEDPLGAYNNGVPLSIALNSASAVSFVTTINYMIKHGGTMIDEGYTHQYSNVPNPYTGVSGDDAEFFLAHVDASNNVVWDGPIPADSKSWAQGRVNDSVAEYQSAKLTPPKYWVTPHYFATDVDYRAVATKYSARYESSLYFSGILSRKPINYAEYLGEFFPYAVLDVYGTTVLPENLGDYEPVSENNHPVRLPADIIKSAQYNLAVRDGYASFFYDPSYGTGPLGQIISGIKGLGYAFVATGN